MKRLALIAVAAWSALMLVVALAWLPTSATTSHRRYLPAVSAVQVVTCTLGAVTDLRLPGGYIRYGGADISGPICLDDGSFLWAATGRREGDEGVEMLLFRQYPDRTDRVPLPRKVNGRGQLSREGGQVWLAMHDEDEALIVRVGR